MAHGDWIVLRDARVLTMDEPAAATAVAIRNGRIVAVGTEQEIWSAVGSDSASVNMRGRTVLPGLIDAHVHWAGYAMARRQVQLEPNQSLAQVVDTVRRYADRRSEEEGWIVGRGWDQTNWARWPRVDDLVPVGDTPVLLTRKDGHAVWLNRAAMTAAGVRADTADPPGGTIVREDNEPTGVLLENAIQLAHSAVPQPDSSELQAAMSDAWPEAWRRGITGCHEMGLTGRGPLFRELSALREAGELGLRFVWYFRRDALEESIALGLRSGLGDAWLRVGGLKLFLDGTLGSQTADMLAGFENDPDNCGIATLGYEEFCNLIREAAAAGIATAVHAIGDAANRKALDGFERLAAENLPREKRLRHRIEHAQLLDAADLPRFKELGVVASMQPIHAAADWAIAGRHWGSRAASAYAWRSLVDHGARLAFGSDAPIESIDPFAGIGAAVTRTDDSGQPPGGWYPGERLTAAEAIAAYSSGAAWAAGQDTELGSIRAGKWADLIVVDRSPPDTAVDKVGQTRVLATMIDGVWVWQASDIDLAARRR